MGYLDPGIFGIVSQIGFGILFVVSTVFLFFFKKIKAIVKPGAKEVETQSEKPNSEPPQKEK